jgi:hypothetical protein
MPVVVDDWLGRASPSQRDSVDGCSRYLQAIGIVMAPDIRWGRCRMVGFLVFVRRCWVRYCHRNQAESIYACIIWANTLRKVL